MSTNFMAISFPSGVERYDCSNCLMEDFIRVCGRRDSRKGHNIGELEGKQINYGSGEKKMHCKVFKQNLYEAQTQSILI